MKKSKYNYFYKKNDSLWCVFNTLTGALALMTEQEKTNFDNCEFSNKEDLVRHGFLVENGFDETQLVNFTRAKRIYMDTAAYFRILTTTKCNARCYYCYEHGVNVETMSYNIAIQTKKFILKNKNLKKVYIHWFGGEPLENYEVIDLIMPDIYDQFTQNNCKVHATITTNASLLNNEMVQKAKDIWHIKSFQITIDDLEDDYNRIKNYLDISNAFEKVVENIGKLMTANIKVVLRINFEVNELDKLEKISRYLLDKFQDFFIQGLLEISPGPIFKSSNICSLCSAYGKKNSKLVEAHMRIEDICSMNNLKQNSNFFESSYKGGQCFACHYNSFVIDPLGNLFKCTLTINEKKTMVGNVETGISPNKEYFSWVTDKVYPDCDNCIFLPLCQGGCKAGYLGYIDHHCSNLISEINEYLEYKLKTLIVRERTNSRN